MCVQETGGKILDKVFEGDDVLWVDIDKTYCKQGFIWALLI
jgi:hypothetical protein